MKYYLVDITCYNRSSLWIEEHNIPFKSCSKGKLNSKIYHSCYFDKNNIDLLLEEILKMKLFSVEEESYLPENMIEKDVYTIFSDGGSFNNGYRNKDKPMFGSYTTIILKNGKEEILNESDGNEDITNNFSELYAGLYGLKWLKENIKDDNFLVIMSSDSQYLMKGINEWLIGWIKRGWKNNEGITIPNLDMWKEVNSFLRGKEAFQNILTCHVKGHSKEITNIYQKYNDICDIKCNEAINVLLSEAGLPLRKIKKRG